MIRQELRQLIDVLETFMERENLTPQESMWLAANMRKVGNELADVVKGRSDIPGIEDYLREKEQLLKLLKAPEDQEAACKQLEKKYPETIAGMIKQNEVEEEWLQQPVSTEFARLPVMWLQAGTLTPREMLLLAPLLDFEVSDGNSFLHNVKEALGNKKSQGD